MHSAASSFLSPRFCHSSSSWPHSARNVLIFPHVTVTSQEDGAEFRRRHRIRHARGLRSRKSHNTAEQTSRFTGQLSRDSKDDFQQRRNSRIVESSRDLAVPSHVTVIQSPSNQFVKTILQLRKSSSARSKLQRALLVGETPLRELCLYHEKRQTTRDRFLPLLEFLLLPEGSAGDELLVRSAQRTLNLSETAFLRACGLETFDPGRAAAAVLRYPPTFVDFVNGDGRSLEQWSSQGTHILALEGVQVTPSAICMSFGRNA